MVGKGKSEKPKIRVTVPAKYYISLLILASVLGIVSLIVPFGNAFHSVFANIGYGIFCSTLVALLVDYGGTISKQKDDDDAFKILTKNLKDAIDNLIKYRIEYENNNIDCDERAFKDWLNFIFNPYGEIEDSIKKTILGYLDVMFFIAQMMKENAIAFASNDNVTEEFLNNLDLLILNLKVILNKDQVLNDTNAFLSSFALYNLPDLIARLFPEYKSVLCEKWNHSEMDRKENSKNKGIRS